MNNQEFTAKTGLFIYEGKIIRLERGHADELTVIDYTIKRVAEELIQLVDNTGEAENMSFRYLYNLYSRDRIVL